MRKPPYVFLVPGFLGFVDLGSFPYFRRVGECLAAMHYDVSPTIVRVETLPSSSLRERATRLAQVIRDHVGDDDRPLHVVAHSTGGLDARLLLTPGASLRVDFDLEPLVRRVRSLVTVATPHHGTPLASIFDGVFGKRTLWLGSLCASHVLRVGRLPLGVARRVVRVLRRPGSATEVNEVIAEVQTELLDALPADKRDPLLRLLDQMTEDQDLVSQLTPEGIELFNAATNDRPGVYYGCVVARGSPPKIGSVLRAGIKPQAQASYAVYSALYRLTARMPQRRVRGVDAGRMQEVAAAYGAPVTWADSDGIVPTLSQIWGELVHVACADHMDLVGHFVDDLKPAEHYDLITSGTPFIRADFEALWRNVMWFMRRAEDCPRAGRTMPALPVAREELVSPRGSSRSSHSVVVSATPSNTERAPHVAVTVPRRALARRIGLRMVQQVSAATLAFAVYEGWHAWFRQSPWLLWLGFIGSVSTLWLGPTRLMRWFHRWYEQRRGT